MYQHTNITTSTNLSLQDQVALEDANAQEWAWADEARPEPNLDMSKRYNVVASLTMMALVIAGSAYFMGLFNINASIIDQQFVSAMERLGNPIELVTNGIGISGYIFIVAVAAAIGLTTLSVMRFIKTMR